MNQPLIPQHPIYDGLDRHNLNVLKKRFLSINRERLERTRLALPPRQLVVLDLLPILFHCNHPMLPGFISRLTPCKISDYAPSKQEISIAKSVGRSFKVHYEPDIHDDIYGLYIMGSVGTIAQSNHSDIDVWLCHRPSLNSEKLSLLEKKCDAITQWAATQGLEVHIFLMNDERFKAGATQSMDTESSGSAQQLLLLDEFYRASIYLAGRMPLWWFVPSHEEANYNRYAHTLLHKRFITPHHVIDFGGLNHIPEGEFVGAGIWQLYKAIESPYKSVLKLLLLELYVANYPNIQSLSVHYKEAVFLGTTEVDELDAYVMLYRQIEAYLISREDYERLELIRRCLYFKVGRPLSRHKQTHNRAWQYEQLRQLVAEWRWSIDTVTMLDTRKQWKVAHVVSERALLTKELNHSYQFLLEFASVQQIDRTISSDELTLLGRKLDAAFERRPGKIEWINPGISKDLSEEYIQIVYESTAEYKHGLWTAVATTNKRDDNEETTNLRSCQSLVELLAWCLYNGVMDTYTQITITKAIIINRKDLSKVIDCLQQWLPDVASRAKHENFARAAQPTKVLWLLNVTSDKTTYPTTHQVSEQFDVFNSGNYGACLINNVHMTSVNSWGEIHVRQFNSDSNNSAKFNHPLTNALLHYLQLSLPGTHQNAPSIDIKCIGSSYAHQIEQRVHSWIHAIIDCFYTSRNTQHGYIFQMENTLHRLRFQSMRPQLQSFRDDNELILSLGAANAHYCGLHIDPHSLTDTFLPIICQKMRRNTVSVFYRKFDIGMEVIIADEKGSLIRHRVRSDYSLQENDEESPLIPLHRFLRTTINRQARAQPELLDDFGVCPVYFYQLIRKAHHKTTLKQVTISQTLQHAHLFDIKATAYSDDNRTIHYDFFCDDQAFHFHAFGDQLFLTVAQFILSRRQHGENYPIYMTDLDLSLCEHLLVDQGQIQISHYLKIKYELEAELNNAIRVLKDA